MNRSPATLGGGKRAAPAGAGVCDRRAFLQGVGAVGAAAWLGVDLWAAEQAADVMAPATTARGILSLRLRAPDLPAQARFYGEVMGFPIDSATDRLVVQAGGTELHFAPAADVERPIYHVAWGIPANLLPAAKAWLAARTPLLVHPDGRDEFHFRSVRRRAVYFSDPAGNVLELIARELLDDRQEGPFALRHILYVNHAGLVVDDLPGAIRDLEQELGLALRADPTPNFAQLGDEHRHLVLVTRERLWLPELTVPAGVFATQIVLQGAPDRMLELAGYPYRVSIEG